MEHLSRILSLCTFMICIIFTLSYYIPRNQRFISHALFAKNQPKPVPTTPEFSRIINAAQISPRKSVVCRLLAKDNERELLSGRLDLAGISYFAANVTLSRQDVHSIVINGTIAATIYNGEHLPEDHINAEFDTVILDNTSTTIGEKINFDDAVDYDDEVGVNGEIDVGEIASQYLSMEII